MNSSKTRKVTIPADILAEIDNLPAKTGTGIKSVFTPEQDAILVKIWESKTQVACIKWWKDKYGTHSKDSLRKRYAELTA